MVSRSTFGGICLFFGCFCMVTAGVYLWSYRKGLVELLDFTRRGYDKVEPELHFVLTATKIPMILLLFFASLILILLYFCSVKVNLLEAEIERLKSLENNHEPTRLANNSRGSQK